MKKNLYDRKYFQDRLIGQQCMVFSIRKFLQQKKAKRILDVGCGSGWLMRDLNKRGFRVTGCDSADEAVKISGGIKANCTSLPFPDEAFDAVLGISLIEHLQKKETVKFVQEACRVLKKGGWLFLVTPNYATPLRVLMGNRWCGSADSSHINFYTPWALQKLLKNYHLVNFQLTFPYYQNIPSDWGFPPLFQKLPSSLKNLITYLIVSTPFYIFRHSFWLAGQKTSG